VVDVFRKIFFKSKKNAFQKLKITLKKNFSKVKNYILKYLFRKTLLSFIVCKK